MPLKSSHVCFFILYVYSERNGIGIYLVFYRYMTSLWLNAILLSHLRRLRYLFIDVYLVLYGVVKFNKISRLVFIEVCLENLCGHFSRVCLLKLICLGLKLVHS